MEAVESEMAAVIRQHMDVSGMRVSIIGMARSGVAVAQLLSQRGADVFVSDAGSAEALSSQVETLKSLGIQSEVGSHSGRVYAADLMVISPGVPSNAPVVVEAVRRKISVLSELEVASWYCPGPIIGITGTNGKTTTTTLVGRMLHDAKINHVVAGNIGKAFSSAVGDLGEDDFAVLEVSSFQLDHIRTFHPTISVMLNITPDHLDRYEGSMERYVASKFRIIENQTMRDVLIYNEDDDTTRLAVQRFAADHVRTLPFSVQQPVDQGAFVSNGKLVMRLRDETTEIIEIDQISIPGLHNLYNSMAAVLTAATVGVSVPSIRGTLRNFKGVEHRLEFVRELRGVRYVNDSKATNVDSVWYALQAFKQPIVLMLGGRDKGNDYEKIAELVRTRVKAIVAIGESAARVEQSFSSIVNVSRADSMEQAVATASKLASAGDIVLLSPACASFDWFQNYEHRGRIFKEAVNAL